MQYKARISVPARAAVCAAAIFASTNLAAAAAITTVALSGDAAPGTSGAVFSGFQVPTINAAGHVTMIGSLEFGTGGVTSENRQGYWTGTKGNLVLLGREGSPLSGDASVSFTDFGVPVAGPVASAVVKASSTAGRGLFGGPAGDVKPIALPGMQAPGYDPGVTFGDQIMGLSFNGPPRSNQLGQTAFTANTIGNPTPGSHGGLWAGSAGNLALVARHGTQAPALPTGVNILSFGEPAINDGGQVAFDAILGGTATAADNTAVYLGQPGALQVVARGGDPVPGMSGVAYAGSTFGGSFGFAGLNNAGQVAFTSGLVGNVTPDNDNALFIASATPGSATVVARDGDAAPNAPAGVTYAAIGAPHLGGGGHVVFDAIVAGPGVTSANNTALFAGLPGAVRMLAREGDVAPGAADGAQLMFFDPATINDDGQVALIGYVQGPGIDFTNNTLLLAADAGGELFTVARTGTPIDLGNGDIRTPDSFYYWGYSGGQDGLGSGLSDNGQLVFAADFTDGTSGLFLVTVPEPSTPALTALAAAAAATARRRRRA